MRGTVVVDDKTAFNKWLGEQETFATLYPKAAAGDKQIANSVKGPKGKTVKAPMVALPEMAKAITDTSVMMDGLLKFPMIKSLLGIKAATQINKTVLSVMTQMRNITTASLFALANGHIGVGASVSDDFDLLFKDLIGKTKDPKKLRDAIDEALEAGALDSSTIATELEKMIPELMGPSKFNITKGGKTSFEGKKVI